MFKATAAHSGVCEFGRSCITVSGETHQPQVFAAGRGWIHLSKPQWCLPTPTPTKL